MIRLGEAALRRHGLAALGGAMKYEKPEVRDFGSIADHTYDQHFGCASGLVDVGICIKPDDV